MQRAHFNGCSEIGAYCLLTNSYAIVGSSQTPLLAQTMAETIDVPIIETKINSIDTVGTMLQGNKHGLLVPTTAQDCEIAILRHFLPDSVRVRRIEERLNALGNVILCNDHVCIVHPELDAESIEIVEHVLGVPVHKSSIGNNQLVGTYAVINNQGMVVDGNLTTEELARLAQLLCVRVVGGTVNGGSFSLGSGVVVNDRVGFLGRTSTNFEIGVMEKVFALRDEN